MSLETTRIAFIRDIKTFLLGSKEMTEVGGGGVPSLPAYYTVTTFFRIHQDNSFISLLSSCIFYFFLLPRINCAMIHINSSILQPPYRNYISIYVKKHILLELNQSPENFLFPAIWQDTCRTSSLRMLFLYLLHLRPLPPEESKN